MVATSAFAGSWQVVPRKLPLQHSFSPLQHKQLLFYFPRRTPHHEPPAPCPDKALEGGDSSLAAARLPCSLRGIQPLDAAKNTLESFG